MTLFHSFIYFLIYLKWSYKYLPKKNDHINKSSILFYFTVNKSFSFGLNMFLIPIKLGHFKFSHYLILIVLLVPNFFSTLSISPYSIQICLIYA